MYISRLQKAIILSREKRIPTRSGRHLSRTEPPSHLANHGRTSSDMVQRGTLSEYFEHCKVNKRTSAHVYRLRKRKNRTIYMLGTLISTFINSRQKEFMKQQRTDEQYAYILSHALITFWIEKVPGRYYVICTLLSKQR